ncbi:hypothetical protein [Caulobacter sp. 17J65-9]|uniref:hypothetical protein n=1 Tax=Caulobacter sp. 17J65-9 TaxID=2709382 RepID=UPI0013C63BAD|nr:hypothetical protein [Caulobacter sp. 17J65-9]NEX91158.1 hypothetical protein [Caulobacter sp. 17J65-9]
MGFFGSEARTRRRAEEWLRARCKRARIVHDLRACFGALLLDVAAIKSGGIVGVIFARPGEEMGLLKARVSMAKDVAEEVWVIGRLELTQVLAQELPIYVGVLSDEPSSDPLQFSGRKNFIDPRALARLLTIPELQVLVSSKEVDHLTLARCAVEAMTGAELKAQVCEKLRVRRFDFADEPIAYLTPAREAPTQELQHWP